MSGKLTYESMIERVRIGLISQLWSDIQADREAIRAEVTASVTEELLKDHFKIGEKMELLSDFWEPVTFGFMTKHGFVRDISNGSFHFRRPPKTRPMTRDEMIEDIKFILPIPPEKSSKWTTETLIEVLGSFKMNLEVPL